MIDDRGDLDLTKQIEVLTKRIQEAELETSIFFEAINKNSIELLSFIQQIEDVKKEADILMMNKIIFYEKDLLRVKYDNKKLANQITEMISRLKDANF